MPGPSCKHLVSLYFIAPGGALWYDSLSGGTVLDTTNTWVALFNGYGVTDSGQVWRLPDDGAIIPDPDISNPIFIDGLQNETDCIVVANAAQECFWIPVANVVHHLED